MAEPEAPQREFLHWALVITVAGPGYRGTVTVEDEDQLNLVPKHVDVNGVIFERYPGELEEEYTEVRFDYIVERRMFAIYATPKIQVAPADGPDFDPTTPGPIVAADPIERGGTTDV